MSIGYEYNLKSCDLTNNWVQTLDVQVYYQIRHLAISPSGLFLAVCTEHTVHIAVLPPSSRLRDLDRSPLKLKTYHLGPTIHVIPESPLASVLWHPLAASTGSTDCIVTITAEAAVRVWELDRSNKWSFERPKLAIDLRKLADGVSCEQNFEPSGFGKSRGFSVDDFDMEVSAACFGGRGRDDEDAWASMTLWTAMRNGDIYALCPLLPSKWKPTTTTIPSLTTTAVSRMALIAGEEADMDERRAADQQYEWVQEIDNDEPQLLESTDSLGDFEVRNRPQNPSAIPRLQGPFTVVPEDMNSEIEISDIYVFPSKLDEEQLYTDEEDDGEFELRDPNVVPFTTICVATPEDEVWLAIDLDGISGQWLPKKGKGAFSVPCSDAKEFTLIETLALDTSSTPAVNWPMFTADVVHNYALFLTTSRQIYSLSLTDWIIRVAAELSQPVDSGLKTRLETSCQSQVCVTDKLLELSETTEAFSAPAIIDDISLGYLLLTSTPSSAYAVSFDQDHLRAPTIDPSSPELTSASPSHLNFQLARVPEKGESAELETLPTRSPYAPAKIFGFNHLLPLEQMRQRLPQPLKRAIHERPMRLSPAMLDAMTLAHRTIGAQSAELEKAAAELFRRCERLRQELGAQVKQMSELAQQLHGLQYAGEDGQGRLTKKKSPETRIKEARDRQAKLVARYEALRRKVGRAGSAKRELTTKEIAWIEEIEALGQKVGVAEGDSSNSDDNARLDERLKQVCAMSFLASNAFRYANRVQVQKLARDLVDESRRLEKQQQEKSPPLDASTSSITPSMSASMAMSTSSISSFKSPASPSFSLGVSSRLQKERIADVMAMVERESAVIDAAMKRLDRLKLEY